VAFITDDQLAQRFADLLRRLGGSGAEVAGLADLPPDQQRMVMDGNVRGRGCVTRHWVTLGYTASQAAAWDEAFSFSRDLGLFFALSDNRANFVTGPDNDPIKTLDRRKELDGLLTMLAGGVAVNPGTQTAAEVMSGTLKARQDFDAAVARDRLRPGSFWDEQRRGYPR
jgi:hypothetical protein